jgi:ABC-type branched-subunit amino acid transport system substrate-binding protein
MHLATQFRHSGLGRIVCSSLLALALIPAQVSGAQRPAQPVEPPAPQTKPVPQAELAIGTHLDLSGPLATWGKAVRNGIQMALDEANEAGGINGRTLRLVAKDDGYDPARAIAAVHDLTLEDRVFAVVSPLGTPTAHAASRKAAEHGVLYLFPVVAGDEAFPAFAPTIFALTPSNRDAVRDGLRRLLETHPNPRLGVMSSDDAFGRSVRAGVDDELQRRGTRVASVVSFARGAKLAIPTRWLREERLDIVVLGTSAQETMEVMRATQHPNWRSTVLCSYACYTPELAALGGSVVEGLYAVGQVPIPYPDDPRLSEWVARYSEKFGAVATPQALAGYRNTKLFLTALEDTGPAPTRERFVKTMEAMGPWTESELAVRPVLYTEEHDLRANISFLAQVRSGRWAMVPEAYTRVSENP